MKIVFFIQDFSRGHGSERVTALISSYLAEYGYEVAIISVCGTNKSFYEISKKVQLYTLMDKAEVDNKKELIHVIREYKKALLNIRPQIVIDVFAAMSVYTNAVKKKLGIHNITWEHYNFYNNLGTYKVSRWLAIHKSDLLITLTNTDLQTYKKHYPQLNIKFIYNPSPFENEILDMKKKERIVIAVGRLTAIKGYSHLIDVWSIVEPQAPDWKLMIVGEGEERQKLEEKIKRFKLRNIVLPGQTKCIQDIYKKASILVATSDMEGLPMNMIEAQSFGIPIVSYDFYTGPRDIINNGIDGYIVNSGNQSEKDILMAKKILELINNDELRDGMMIRAMESSKRFKMQRIGREWISIIEGLRS